jgi:hypothetical protein
MGSAMPIPPTSATQPTPMTASPVQTHIPAQVTHIPSASGPVMQQLPTGPSMQISEIQQLPSPLMQTPHPATATQISPTTLPATTTQIFPATLPATATQIFPTTLPATGTQIFPTTLPTTYTATQISSTTLPAAATQSFPTSLPATATQISSYALPATGMQIFPTLPTAATQISPHALPATGTQVFPATLPTAATQVSPTTLPAAATQSFPTTLPATGTQISPTTLPTMQVPPATARRLNSNSHGSGSGVHAARLSYRPYPSPSASLPTKKSAAARKNVPSTRASMTPSGSGSYANSSFVDPDSSDPHAAGMSTDGVLKAIANKIQVQYALACLCSGPAATVDDEPTHICRELAVMACQEAGLSRMIASFCIHRF